MGPFGLDLGVGLHMFLRWLAITFGIGYGLS
ncbi:hypothetical protein NG2371_05746 [Nocardia gamkensis]|nr:hypothetical protein [Nocardia gamkensis]